MDGLRLAEQRQAALPGKLPVPGASPRYLQALRRHSEQVASFSLILAEPLDWTAFGIWLSLLLNRHGDDVLRVKGILQVQGSDAPVFINAVQHIVHPPQHLERWPSDDIARASSSSRAEWITRACGARWRRSATRGWRS